MLDGTMSAAENRPLTASSRPVERVALPAGPARDLRDAIYQVYAEAGCPRLDELANAVADDDSLSGAPRKDLIGKVISGDTLATQQDCVTVAAALAREAGRADVATLTDKIRHLWVAARTASPADAGEAARPLGQPISACDPIALEVHRAIDVPDGSHQLSPLPAYVERAHDRRLRELADQVLAGASRMITLVGGSSTGKTRACWELAGYVERQQPGRWRLWHPYDPTRPDAAADALDQVGPHTIVWLNEAQLYLAPLGRHLGERIAAGLRTLLTEPGRGPVLVLATMWPGHWTALTSRPAEDRLADPHAPARELLTSTDLDVPDAFSTVDLTGLDTRGDPRLRRAGRHAVGGRITQYLAGAPLLLDRYRNAPPSARAVLDVAIDVRRLGHLPAIPHALLAQAAAGYLDDDQWNLIGDDWLDRALAYAAQPCNGTRGPLTRLRPRPGEPAPQGDPVYRLADYLEQTGAIQRADVYPPSGFWDAAASAIGDAATLHVLGRAAEQRGRYRHAAGLYRATTDRGDLSALNALTRLLEQAGDPDSAAGLLREAADRGNTYALNHLAFRRERAGDPDGAARLYRQAADHGSTGALSALARLHEQAGDSASAVRLARQATGGRTGVLSSRAQRGERAGDVTGAANRYREAADHGDPGELGARLRQQAADRADTVALINQARLRERAGDSDGAVSAARQAADRGHTGVLSSLALQRDRAGDPVGAARLAREAADRGNPIVLSNLARRRERAGDPDGAAGLYREAADRGNINALGNLARLRERAGDQEGADRIRRFGLDVDGSPAAPWTLC
jgi:hypothetical protein